MHGASSVLCNEMIPFQKQVSSLSVATTCLRRCDFWQTIWRVGSWCIRCISIAFIKVRSSSDETCLVGTVCHVLVM